MRRILIAFFVLTITVAGAVCAAEEPSTAAELRTLLAQQPAAKPKLKVPIDSPKDWKSLSTAASFLDWRADHHGWITAGEATMDPKETTRLRSTSGEKILVCAGDGANLLSDKDFQDVEVRLEFMIPKDSNSGVKLNGLYEIQIVDTHGKEKLNGDDCGGIYPRGENEPDYHVIDDGFPPHVNAAKPAGVWQTLEIGFVGPRFDAAGKKTSNAKFTRVVLNGQVIHENVEVPCPTGSNWRLAKEIPRGPIMLQGDHGPVAFRNIAVKTPDQKQ